ncbi:MAG: hypothetical protein LBN37_07910 [Bacteroidales bacterium]|jgi:hypothetical protein|nr:hypothetical protein [Bacteroidales bacterium]
MVTFFHSLNWWWYSLSVIIVFGIGALWYSVLFPKMWVRVFRIQMGTVTTGSFIRTMGIQLASTAVFGIIVFILALLDKDLALLVIIGLAAWLVGTLNFKFPRMKDFLQAILIEVGYLLIAGHVFILFGLL